MTIGPTPDFYTCTLSASIPAGNFYISLDHSARSTYLSTLTSGSSGIAYWRRPPMGSGAFSRSGIVSRSSFRVLCAGGGQNATPVLSNDGLPEIGHSFDVKIAQGRANAPATLVNGLSNTTWGAIPLPFSLQPLGGQNCDLLVAMNFQVGLALDSQGSGMLTFPVPNNSAYLGLKVYHQFYVIDPAANTLGLAVSQGGESKVGQR